MPEKLLETPDLKKYKKEIAASMKALLLKSGISTADIAFHLNQKDTSAVNKALAGEKDFSAEELRSIDELLAYSLGRFSTFEALYGEKMPTSHSIDALKPLLFDALTETVIEICEVGQMRLAPSMTPSSIFKIFLDHLEKVNRN